MNRVERTVPPVTDRMLLLSSVAGGCAGYLGFMGVLTVQMLLSDGSGLTSIWIIVLMAGLVLLPVGIGLALGFSLTAGLLVQRLLAKGGAHGQVAYTVAGMAVAGAAFVGLWALADAGGALWLSRTVAANFAAAFLCGGGAAGWTAWRCTRQA